MAETTLNSWSVIDVRRKRRLAGVPSSGPKEGKYVVTSEIADIHGRTVTTASGTRYLLGTIENEYLQWMKEHGYTYNEKEPIKALWRN